MSSRIKIRFGDVEVEYEGADDFLKAELPSLLKAVSELHRMAPVAKGKTAARITPSDSSESISVTTIAQKLNANKLPDLIMAAALALGLRGQNSFEKKDLRKEMRGAVGFWKAAMATNFDKTLTRLAKAGRVTHSGGENYALPPAEQESLSTRIGVSEAAA